jgi:hypothetical protein
MRDRRTSVPCTLPTPALSDFVTSTSDYLAPSLEHNTSPTDIKEGLKWFDDVHDLLPPDDEPQPDNAVDYIASHLYRKATCPTDPIT